MKRDASSRWLILTHLILLFLSRFTFTFPTESQHKASLLQVKDLLRRQSQRGDDGDDGVGGAEDTTAALRAAVNVRRIYINNDQGAAWYQIDPGQRDADALFRADATTRKGQQPPPPSDASQGASFNVDHVLELQLITGFFEQPKPPQIAQEVWIRGTSSVNSPGIICDAIATEAAAFENLRAITSRANNFKKEVFRHLLGHSSGPQPETYLNYYGPAMHKYLQERQGDVIYGVATRIGTQLASAGDELLRQLFINFITNKWREAFDFLDSWVGGNPRLQVDAGGNNSTGTASPTTQSSRPSALPASQRANLGEIPNTGLAVSPERMSSGEARQAGGLPARRNILDRRDRSTATKGKRSLSKRDDSALADLTASLLALD